MKRLHILLLILSAVIGMNVRAQEISGIWTVYPRVDDTYGNVIETPDKVYLLTGGTLLHMSYDDNEFYTYTADKLSESSQIAHIYYNAEGRYLMIVYNDSNIDLLYDNGRVVNLPEVRDAVLTTSRTINGVCFRDGRIYIAADFGIVVYDDVRHQVIESGLFGTPILKIFTMGDRMLLLAGNSAGANPVKCTFYSAPLEGRHQQLSGFNTLANVWIGKNYVDDVVKVSDSKIALVTGDGQPFLRTYTYDAATGTDEITSGNLSTSVVVSSISAQNGHFTIIGKDGRLHFVSETVDGGYSIPAGAVQAFSTTGTPASVWFLEGTELKNYDLSGESPVLKLTVPRPDGFTVPEPVQMVWSEDGRHLYVANKSASYIYENSGDNFREVPFYIDHVYEGNISDAAVLDANTYTNRGWQGFFVANNSTRLGSACRVVVDNVNPDRYYVACQGPGILTVEDGKILSVFGKSNTPIPSYWWLTRMVDVAIDPDGNLWAGMGYAGDLETSSGYFILPKEKLRGDLTAVKTSDWIVVPRIQDMGRYISRDSRMLFTRKTPGYAFFVSGDAGFGVESVRFEAGYTDVSSIRSVQYNNFEDYEGNVIGPYHINDLKEDASGRIWLATTQGVFYFMPSDPFSADFRVHRPIVPRNDGTNYGDYLLGGEEILGVACDPSDRKWLATANSGVYLVNADGTAILAHFNTNNSPLPSNKVECVTCDPLSNRVYFGTPQGVVAFDSNSSPAADDYSDVYAYPNPVRPDYTGWITVKGLMDNSLVKIADAAGNVFFTGTSEGGMITWDGCDSTGRRVRSGVYFVLASQNASGSSSGVVTKIMVVN